MVAAEKRDYEAPKCRVRKCFCLSLQSGMIVGGIYELLAAFVALLFVILDQAASDNPSIKIPGSFYPEWRVLVWKQWLACNVIMLFAHLLIIIVTAFLIIKIATIKKLKVFLQIPTLQVFFWLMIVYTVTEFIISIYEYSWYGISTIRLAFTGFAFFFWILRFFCNVIFIVCVHSRIVEIRDIISSFEPETYYDPEREYTIANMSMYSDTTI